MSTTAERFLELLQADQQMKLALLACSAALQLDDDTACEAVDLVAPASGSTYELVRRVKELGCVWKEWNGFWHVSEDVRRDLCDQLYEELPGPAIERLHELFAKNADYRAYQITFNDKDSAHERMLAKFEAAYHRVLIPAQHQKGASDLMELWQQLPSSTGDTLALAVDYLADELHQRLGRLPEAVVFLRDIAARAREAEAALNEAPEPPIQVPETWITDATVTTEDLTASIHEQAYQFAMSYYRQRKTRPPRDTGTLSDELYQKFFAPYEAAWQSQAEFYAYVAQLIRRILLRSARTQYSTKLDTDLHSRLQKDEFGAQPADLLALDKAIELLQEYDPDQARIVHLRVYAGLTLEKIADVLPLPMSTVEREWRTARAFLKRELTRENIDAAALIPAGPMTTTNDFLRKFAA